MTAQDNIWVIGDLQGCSAPLHTLLVHPDIAADPDAQLWFAGDLVNRGPDSLGALETVMKLGERCVAVLGNHDLHLLAAAAGIREPGKSDTIHDILDAPDAQRYIDWLRHRPLVHYAHKHLLVHAGVLPAWDIPKTRALANEIETALRGPDWRRALKKMYGNKPTHWRDDLSGGKRMRVIINALTRMRLCTPQGHMDLSHKGPPVRTDHLMPWFDVPGRLATSDTIVFGHWSTLGLLLRDDVVCLDTGCIWGRQLTAMRLHDRKLVQVSCGDYGRPPTHPAT